MLANPWGLTLTAGTPFRLACGAVLMAGEQQVLLAAPSGQVTTVAVVGGNVSGALAVLGRKIEQAAKQFASPLAAAARELGALRGLAAALRN